jgi:hemolysin-activating ACP:hemolysin acyltransferase
MPSIRAALAAYVCWRPAQPEAALGLAVEYLCAKPAFAALPFGLWSQTLFWQVARKHYVFVLDADRRVRGFLGWAFVERPLADLWLKGESGLTNAQCRAGDCVIVNAWAADDPCANEALMRWAGESFAGGRAVYYKRRYADGRERAVRLPLPGHRRRGRQPERAAEPQAR